jgi:hypothetical protein
MPPIEEIYSKLSQNFKNKNSITPPQETTTVINENDLNSSIDNHVSSIKSSEVTLNSTSSCYSSTTITEYYTKLKFHIKNILCSENELKIQKTYKKHTHTPASLVHYRFPQPMFNSLNKEYFVNYNKAIETCQQAIIDINIGECERRIKFSKREVMRICDILLISDKKIVEKINDLEARLKQRLEASFGKENEACMRQLKETVLKYPLNNNNNNNNNMKPPLKPKNVLKQNVLVLKKNDSNSRVKRGASLSPPMLRQNEKQKLHLDTSSLSSLNSSSSNTQQTNSDVRNLIRKFDLNTTN